MQVREGNPISLEQGATAVAPADALHRYPPGDLVIWIFILAELLVFGIFFASYAFTRLNHVQLFNQYQLTLDRDAALINTQALFKGQLIGDWFMGLRGVRGIWRWVIITWLFVFGGLITLALVLTY